MEATAVKKLDLSQLEAGLVILLRGMDEMPEPPTSQPLLSQALCPLSPLHLFHYQDVGLVCPVEADLVKGGRGLRQHGPVVGAGLAGGHGADHNGLLFALVAHCYGGKTHAARQSNL